MAEIEERVVAMKFDTSKFDSKFQPLLDKLKSLREGLKFEGAQKGIEEVSSVANKFSLDGMKNHVDGVMARFTALQVAAATALSNIVNKAVDAGIRLTKSLTIDPLTSGFREYETNLNSIQTILANTGLKGAEGLHTVTSALEELNEYSDQTIYNFSEMAKNIGTFTAAGVKLDVATSAIKGIANLAAISGSNAEQASAAMYQLSQALAAGKVTLEDWNSVVNAGMGGKVFQDALVETARVHGKNVDEIIKKQGSFRLSLEKGWLTSEILTETLSKFTGELSAEQLKSMGYTDEQAAGILEMGQTAVDAATKVKTLTQLSATLKESLGSGWSKTWQIIFGDFDEAKGTFTGVSNVLGGIIQKSSDARNDLLKGWKDLGGRTALLDGIANTFQALISIMRPIRDAFREIFPATTAQQLFEMTVNFRNFMERLKIGEETANNLRRTFAGFFAILGIGWELIKAGIGFIGDLFGKVSQGSGSFLQFTGNIGDFLVKLHELIRNGEAFGKVFGLIGTILSVPITILRELGQVLSSISRHINLQAVENALLSFGNVAEAVGAAVSEAFGRITGSISSNVNSAESLLGRVWSAIKKIVSAIGEALSGLTGGDVLAGLNTGAFITFTTLMFNFFKNFKPGDFLEGITDSLDGLSGSLKAMQYTLSAAALLTLAIAIGVLTLSISTLSKIDDAGLKRASTALAVMVGELAAAYVLFSRIGTTAGAAKMIIMATGMLRLAAAIRVLVSSVEALAKLKTSELAKGLVGVMVLMVALVKAVNAMPTKLGGVVKTSTALLILSFAIRSLVNAVEDFGKMDWESLAKGLVGVSTLLGALALFTKFANTSKISIGAGIGLILLATSMRILAEAVGDFARYNWEQLARGMSGIAVGLGLITAAIRFLPEGAVLKAAGFAIVAYSLKMIAEGVSAMSGLSWDEIARGITVMAGSLASIALALKLLPPNSVMSAVAILGVAASLQIIQQALGAMGGMSWEEIGKGLTVLAASLVLIAGAIYVLQGAVGGAVAIVLVAGALTLLVPILQTLGEMTWGEIVAGLAALAGVFVILGLAGFFLGPLAPVILSLAGSIALLGLAVLAAGLGVVLFGTGLTLLATAGVAATAAILGIVSGLVGLIPYVMGQIALGLVAFAKIIGESGPTILKAITTVLDAFLQAIIDVTPKAVDALLVLLSELLGALDEVVPKLVEAGAKAIIAVLRGMADNIGKIVDVATDLIVNFLDALGRNLPRIIEAGINLIISFVNGVGDGIRNNGPALAEAGWNLASGIVEGVLKGIGSLVGKLVDAAIDMAKKVFQAAKEALGIASPSKKGIYLGKMFAEGTTIGIEKNSHFASEAASEMGEGVIDSMAKTLTGLSTVLGSDLIDFNPTISPVLDLTGVKKEAEKLEQLFSGPSLSTSSSYVGVKSAGYQQEQNRSGNENSESLPGGDTYNNYVQNNTSPKALSRADIYRQTKNLIARTIGDVNAEAS